MSQSNGVICCLCKNGLLQRKAIKFRLVNGVSLVFCTPCARTLPDGEVSEALHDRRNRIDAVLKTAEMLAELTQPEKVVHTPQLNTPSNVAKPAVTSNTPELMDIMDQWKREDD